MKKRSGKTAIEFIFTTLLLIIFSSTAFFLVAASSESYKKIETKRAKNSDIRIALSYLNNKIRQAGQGNISIIEDGNADSPLIIIKDEGYYSAIYLKDNLITEGLFFEGEELNLNNGVNITPIENLTIEALDTEEIDKNIYKISVSKGKEKGVIIADIKGGEK